MKSWIIPLLLLWLVAQAYPLPAQQDRFRWRLGAYGGVMSYYGDLTDRFRPIQPTPRTIQPLKNIDFHTFGFSAETALSNAFSAGLQYSRGRWTANDRAIDWKNDPQRNNTYFLRSLNAQTRVNNISLYAVYHFDNDALLDRSARLAPYLRAGVGLSAFRVFGDLYHGPGQNQPYYYWPDGSIRDLPEGNPAASVVSQDGDFETDLAALETEGKDYNTAVVTPLAGLGLKFRLSERLNLNLDYTFFFTLTDYLDDVSGDFLAEYDNQQQAYAANPAGWPGPRRGSGNGNDFYTFASLSLHYNLARKERAFRAPVIRTGVLSPPSPQAQADSLMAAVQTDTAAALALPAPVSPVPIEAPPALTDTIIPPPSLHTDTTVLTPALPDSLKTALLSRDTVTADTTFAAVPPPADTLRPAAPKEGAPVSARAEPAPTPDRAPADAAASPDQESLRELLLILNARIDSLSRRIPPPPASPRTDTVRTPLPADLPARIEQMRQEQFAQQQQLRQELAALRYDVQRLRETFLLAPAVAVPPAPDTGIRDTLLVPPPAPLDSQINRINLTLDRLAAVQSDTASAAGRARVSPEIAALRRQLADMRTERERERRATEEALARAGLPERDRELAGVQAELATLREAVERLANARPGPALPEENLLADKITGRERQSVYFRIGATALTPQAQTGLRQVAELLNQHDRLGVRLTGFADASGDADRNRVLAGRRAAAVETYLREQGIAAGRIEVLPGGIDANANPPALGRRVEVEVYIKQ